MRTPPTTTIALDDLQIVAHAFLLRLPLRTPEARRVARLRELLEISSELGRQLAAQTHCGRVHCQGSHGTGDLHADTAALYGTLAAFGALTRAIADEYRHLVDEAVPPAFDGRTPPLAHAAVSA